MGSEKKGKARRGRAGRRFLSMRVLKLSSAAVIVMLLFFASLPCASTPPSGTKSQPRCGLPDEYDFEWFTFGKRFRAQFPGSFLLKESICEAVNNRFRYEKGREAKSFRREVCTDEEIVNEIMKMVSPGLIVLQNNSEDSVRTLQFKELFRKLVKKGVKERSALILVNHEALERFGDGEGHCGNMKNVKEWVSSLTRYWYKKDIFCEKLSEIFYGKRLKGYAALGHGKV